MAYLHRNVAQVVEDMALMRAIMDDVAILNGIALSLEIV